MPRVKVDLPKHFSYRTEMVVRVSDVNYGGHLGNDSILSLIHEARTRYFRHHGFSELDVGGVGTIMVDAAIVYKSEAFHGDPVLIEIALADFHKFGFDFFYRLSHKETGKEIARAKTGMACFDYTARKLQKIPQKFITKCGLLKEEK